MIYPPSIIETTGRSSKAFDLPTKLLQDRIIYLGDEINSDTANYVIMQMLWLNADNPNNDIDFYINSPGGSVYDGLAILDTMNFVQCDVATFGIGLQASMGAVLLSGGAKGKRSVLPNARVMIHQPSSGTKGMVTDQEISLRESVRIKELLIDIMASNTGQKRAKIKADMERDFWMDAKEAKDYGLIDAILAKSA